MPGVAPDQHQRPHPAAAPALRVRDQAEVAEVHLHDLARRRLLHPDGGGALPTPAATGHEAMQGAVRDGASALAEELADARELEPVGGDPSLDLLRPGREQLLGRGLRLPGTGDAQRRERDDLLLRRLEAVTPDPGRLRGLDVARHGHARQPGTLRDLALALPSLPAPDDLPYLGQPDLPVAHPSPSLEGDDGGRTGPSGGQRDSRGAGLMILVSCPNDPG